ncbi:hypothetical protein D3C73_1375610 [compost metagenome]
MRVVRMERLPCQMVHRPDAFVACGMGQLQPADAIANCVDMRLVGLHIVIDFNNTFAKMNIGILQPDVLYVGYSAYRYQQLLG